MTPIESPTPILGFAAYSGTGKTTLLTKIIPLLKDRNIRLGIIKHAHHEFDIDQPGKDSYKLRKAGAERMLIASSKRWALMVENEANDPEPSLQALIDELNAKSLDLILVEGFKHENYPKIELHRSDLNKEFMHPNDSSILAVATDTDQGDNIPIRQLDINSPSQIVTFICDNFLKPSAPATTSANKT